MNQETTRELREISKNRLQARRDSDAMAAGIAAYKRYCDQIGAKRKVPKKMLRAERWFDEAVEMCDAAAAAIRSSEDQ